MLFTYLMEMLGASRAQAASGAAVVEAERDQGRQQRRRPDVRVVALPDLAGFGRGPALDQYSKADRAEESNSCAGLQ